MTIYSINKAGKKRYVAHFAQLSTAQRFLDQMNLIYVGHLRFEMEP